MMKWSEKTPNDTPDSSIVGGIKTAQARQCICTLQVQMQTKIEQSPSEMLVEAQRNFLMAMKRLRCVCQTVICLCAIPMPLACIGGGHSAEAPTAASASLPHDQCGGAPDKVRDFRSEWLFFIKITIH